MKKIESFTQGRILAPLLKFATPVMLALMLQAMYGSVDLMIVGRFGGPADVSAVSTGTQVMHTFTMLISGLATAITVLIGQRIGEGKKDQAGEIIGSGVYLFGVLTAAMTIIMLFAAPFAARVMQVPDAAFSKAVDYVRICSAGLLFIIFYNFLGSVFRGIGDSKTPLLTVAIACVINIVGDLFFVGVLGFAAQGAAMATVIAQGSSVILSLMIIRKRQLPFDFSLDKIRYHKENIFAIIKMGFPISLQSVLVSVSFLAITSIVNSLGVVSSAGVGVAEKLCSFIMLVPAAFMQSTAAFVAQNIGAGKRDRAIKAMYCGMGCSLAFSCVFGYLGFFHGDIMASIFSAERDVILAAAEYLKAYAIDTFLVSFMFCFTGFFNGCGKTTFVMWQGIIGAFGVRIPFSYLMSKAANVTLFRIGLATPASTAVQIVLCVAYFIYLQKQDREQKLISEN